jgi:ABC-type bacteriocin/lantibiotic exporter with double-glycine peptidase domain
MNRHDQGLLGKTAADDGSRLRTAFPALERLGEVLRRREVPFVPQTTMTDCGAASLVMVLAYHGREIRLEEMREAMAVDRGGTSARAILQTATLYELRGRGVKVEVADLHQLPPATILHWDMKHFVVFERVERGEIIVIDPAFGRRAISVADAERSFTGIALLFEKGDDFTAASPNESPLRRYLRRAAAQSTDLGRIVVSSLLLQVFAMALPFINGRLIDRAVPRGDYQLLFVLVASFAFVVVFTFIAQMVRGHLLLQLRTRFDASMTLGFIDHLLRLPYAFFQRRQTADLMLRVNSMAAVREVLTSSLLSGAIDGILVLSYVALLLAFSIKIAIAAISVVFIQSLVFVATRKHLRQLAAGSLAKQAEASSYLQEMLAGVESLKAIGGEHEAAQHWSSLYVELLNINLRRGATAAWSDAMLGTIRVASPILILLTGILEVMNGSMTLGTMLTTSAFATGFVQPMINLVGTFTQLQFVTTQLARVDDVLSTPVEQHEEGGRALQNAPRLTGRIELRNVSFRYGQSGPPVVDQVSASIAPGELIGIVGPSGSGKSTLASLLLGLYRPTDGDVLYDGIRLTDMDLRSVRRQLGVVVQKAYVFGSTIRANIGLGDPDLPLERIQAAAEQACIHEDIAKMGLGYDTPVVAGGGSLSGGQRQRIAFARALLTKPAILLLDEATSALDSLTERRLQRNLDALGCTRIVIAHRLSTVVHASRILVMRDGRLVETGTHDELVSRDSFYRELVLAQEPEILDRAGPASGPTFTRDSSPTLIMSEMRFPDIEFEEEAVAPANDTRRRTR